VTRVVADTSNLLDDDGDSFQRPKACIESVRGWSLSDLMVQHSQLLKGEPGPTAQPACSPQGLLAPAPPLSEPATDALTTHAQYAGNLCLLDLLLEEARCSAATLPQTHYALRFSSCIWASSHAGIVYQHSALCQHILRESVIILCKNQ